MTTVGGSWSSERDVCYLGIPCYLLMSRLFLRVLEDIMWPLFTSCRKLEKELTEVRALLRHCSCNQLSHDQSCDQSCDQSQVSERGGLKWRLRCQTRQTNYCRVKLGQFASCWYNIILCSIHWPLTFSLQDMLFRSCGYTKSWRLPWRHTLLSFRPVLPV